MTKALTGDLATLIIHPPMPRSAPLAGIEAALRTQDCMIRMAGSFDAFEAKLDTVATLVGVAAKMVDGADRSYLGGLERGEENRTVDVLDRLAETLSVPISEFFVVPAKGSSPPKPLKSGRRASR